MIFIERYLGYLTLNSVLVRLIVVRNNKEYNVLFDSSFSFKDNLDLLSNIVDESFDNCFIYDKKLNIFLNNEIALDNYNLPSSRTFYIY